MIVCPTSLVGNWAQEIEKWAGDERFIIYAATGSDVPKCIRKFCDPRDMDPKTKVLILPYDTFRLHADKFTKGTTKEDSIGCIDMLVCDEAHRLKNAATLASVALDRLDCKRRVLLSGTPIQNDLEEFYAMVQVCVGVIHSIWSGR